MRPNDGQTTIERASERELMVQRVVAAPVKLVFKAWSRPEVFQRWWAPKSFGLTILSYDADVCTGGSYRLVMNHPSSERPLEFFGKYIEVEPDSRIVWTNEEDDGGPVTTVTFEEKGGETLVTVRELYPSKEALDEAIDSGSTSGWNEQFQQLETLLTDSGVAPEEM